MQRIIWFAGIVMLPLFFASCGDNSTGKTEKDVDTVAPMNRRFEDDTSMNTVNRLSGHDQDTVTIIKKDSADLKKDTPGK